MTKREAFKKKIETRIRFSNGYYYVGDYQPITMTGRYSSKQAAIQSQMDKYDFHQAECCEQD